MLAGRMRMLAANPELRARLGAAARQLTLERFSLDEYVRAIHRIILGEVAQGSSLIGGPPHDQCRP